MSVPVRAGETLGAGTPEVVVERPRPIPVGGGFSTYGVAPEGDRFLMMKPTTSPATGAGPTDLVVVQGWFEELKERVPVP